MSTQSIRPNTFTQLKQSNNQVCKQPITIRLLKQKIGQKKARLNYSTCYKRGVWIHIGEVEKKSTQEHKGAQELTLSTKQMAKTYSTLVSAPFYKSGLLPIHTMGGQAINPPRV